MEEIIAPVSRDLLLQELTPETQTPQDQQGRQRDLYHHPPQRTNVMREIGRLREIAFVQPAGEPEKL